MGDVRCVGFCIDSRCVDLSRGLGEAPMTEPKPTEAEIQTVFDAITECMFAPHELPLADDLAARYRETARHTLVRLASARSPAPEWRDIESAPQDGTWVLVFDPHENHEKSVSIACCYTNAWMRTPYAKRLHPTHFMPLPSPPKETT